LEFEPFERQLEIPGQMFPAQIARWDGDLVALRVAAHDRLSIHVWVVGHLRSVHVVLVVLVVEARERALLVKK
jgi:hypothetical protein